MRFGYSRTRIGQNVEANLASPLPPFVAGRGLVGDIDIGGMQRFGPQTSANLRLAQNVYSGQYDVTHTRGRHLLKAGVLAEHYRDFMTNPTFSLGIYTFANLRAFLENRALRFVGLAPRGRHRPRLAVDALRLLRAGQLHGRRRALTLNAGLRYEFTTMPVDDGRARLGAHQPERSGADGRRSSIRTRALKNLSPRVGRWRGTCSATARRRCAAATASTSTPTNQQNLIVTVTNPPATPRFVIANATFPNPPFERGIGNTIRPVQWELENPRLHVWNASVQRALPAELRRHARLRRLARARTCSATPT